MSGQVRNAAGNLGEDIARVRLCALDDDLVPRFQAAFLGEKWEATDLLVVGRPAGGLRPYCFAQVKATAAPLVETARGGRLPVAATRADVAKLRQTPGPTYLVGVHLPSERAFVRAVHAGTPDRGIGRIPVAHELTAANLDRLHAEVLNFWSAAPAPKPTGSRFA